MSRTAPATPALSLAGTPFCVAPDGHRHALGAPDALMLAWLAIEGPSPRERLAALLWPESPGDVARNALRQRLFRLRRVSHCELVTGSQQLALADSVTHDLAEASTLLGTLQVDAGALHDWLDLQRQRRREGQRQQLSQRIAALEASGDAGSALPLAEALLALDPTREDAHQRLMRLHYLGGDRSAALLAFDRCEAVLKHELGTRPSPDTLALLATIEAAERDSRPSSPARRTLPAALMRPPQLVGRDAELTRLRQVMARGGRLLLSGEAGLGKSRLLQALAEGGAAGAGSALLAAARPGDALVPYAVLARLLRAVQQRQPQALQAAPAAQLAPLLPELASAAAVAPAAAARGPRRPQLGNAVQAVLAAAVRGTEAGTGAGAGSSIGPGQRLAACVLDDLHFADEASLQLLGELLAAAPAAEGPAWILSLRPPGEGTPQARLVATLATSALLEPLALQALDDAALAEMVDSLALPGVDGARLAGALRQRSGGNPLFALETLKAAWSEGHALDADTLPRPRSVGQLIDAALAALSPDALLLARVAAIAGADFSVELAAHVLGRSPLQLADAWAELEARQVLRGASFAHDLMQESVLAAIPEVLARHTHGTVAHWLEARLPGAGQATAAPAAASGEAAPAPARIAAHWEAAGQPARALPSLRAAAAQAHAALREPERVALLLHGADLAEAGGRREEAFTLVGEAIEAHMNTVRDAAGLPLLDRLDRLAATPLQRALATGHRAWYCSTQGDWAGAIDAGQRAWSLASDPQLGTEGHARNELLASVSQRLGTALAMAGRFDEALPRLQAAEAWVDAHADSNGASEFQGNVAAVLDNLGRPAEAQPYHQRVIAATAAGGDHSFLATARANLAVSRLNAGDAAGAAGQLALAQQLIASYGLRGASAGFIAALQAQSARIAGHYTQALQWCDEAEALLVEASPGWLPVVHMHRAQCLLELGQPARAQQALAACDLAALPARLRARHAWLRSRLPGLAPADAAAALAQALALAPTTGWPELRLTLRTEHASRAGDGVLSAGRAAQLLAVADEALQLGLRGVALAALLRLAAGADGPPAGAAEVAAGLDAARAAEALLAGGVAPNGLYRGECWLAPARAAAAAGQAGEAARHAAAGWHWVQQIAANHVPEAFRDGFLHRQPVNLALRRLLTAP